MLGPDDSAHFDHERRQISHGSFVQNSSLGRTQRSSVSRMQSDILVELGEDELAGQKGPKKNSEACSE